MDSPFVPLPFLLPHPDDLIAILPRKFWVDAVVRFRKVCGPTNRPFSLFTPGDQRGLSQWGLGWGTHRSGLLSPTKEAQLKGPRTENTINRIKIQKQCPHLLSQFYHRISFPMLFPIKYCPFAYATSSPV
jgi:hypothetical protein